LQKIPQRLGDAGAGGAFPPGHPHHDDLGDQSHPALVRSGRPDLPRAILLRSEHPGLDRLRWRRHRHGRYCDQGRPHHCQPAAILSRHRCALIFFPVRRRSTEFFRMSYNRSMTRQGWHYGLLALAFLWAVWPALSQDDTARRLWQALESLPPNRVAADIWIQPEAFRAFNLDGAALSRCLSRAPAEFAASTAAAPPEISLPMPDG